MQFVPSAGKIPVHAIIACRHRSRRIAFRPRVSRVNRARRGDDCRAPLCERPFPRRRNFINKRALFDKAMLPDVKTLEGYYADHLWLLGVPLVVVVLLMLTHVI
jgi:hypothetical protein